MSSVQVISVHEIVNTRKHDIIFLYSAAAKLRPAILLKKRLLHKCFYGVFYENLKDIVFIDICAAAVRIFTYSVHAQELVD